MIATYVGENKEFERQFLQKELEVELVPQGTFSERIRAGGAGIAGFFTPTGVGTLVAEGKEVREFDGRALRARARAARPTSRFVKAWTGRHRRQPRLPPDHPQLQPDDGDGRRATTIAEVEQLVDAGAIDPDLVHTPGIFVQQILQGTRLQPPDREAHGEGLSRGQSRTHRPPRRPRAAGRRLRQPRHRHADAGGELPARRRRDHAALRERHARRRAVSDRGRARPRSHQRRQGDGHRAAGRELLQQRRLVRDDPRRPHRRDRARRARGGRRGQSRQLDGARQDGQGHGRGDGSRRRRQARHHRDGAHDQGRRVQDPAALHAAAHRRARRRPDRHRAGGHRR